MAETTHIEWADATWNPITGCTLVSEGCRLCYAATLAAGRLKHHPSRKGLARVNADGEAKFTGEVRFNEAWLDQPLRWKKPRRIFVCAHGDLFHERVPDEWIDRVFAVMAMAPQHVFIVLTKRPERMREFLAAGTAPNGKPGHKPFMRITGELLDRTLTDAGISWSCFSGDRHSTALFADKTWPLSNVWLGVSVEDQASANERIPILLDTPAAVRFISAEPLLGPVDLTLDDLMFESCPADCEFASFDFETGASECRRCEGTGKTECPGLDWVIVGGESGRDARPMHPDWAQSLRNQCAAAGVPFFFKQWGEWSPAPAGASHPLECNRVPGSRSRVEVICQAGKPIMQRVGKRAAGHLLDGVEHFNWPEAAKVPA